MILDFKYHKLDGQYVIRRYSRKDHNHIKIDGTVKKEERAFIPKLYSHPSYWRLSGKIAVNDQIENVEIWIFQQIELINSCGYNRWNRHLLFVNENEGMKNCPQTRE